MLTGHHHRVRVCRDVDRGGFVNGTHQFAFAYGSDGTLLLWLTNQAGITLGVKVCGSNQTVAGRAVTLFEAVGSNATNCELRRVIFFTNTSVSALSAARVVAVTQGRHRRLGELRNLTYWSEPTGQTAPVYGSYVAPTTRFPTPQPQLRLTRDRTEYLWYRRNVSVVCRGRVGARSPMATSLLSLYSYDANSLLVFWEGEFVGSWTNHDHSRGSQSVHINFTRPDCAATRRDAVHLLEILSISLGLDSTVTPGTQSFAAKGIHDMVTLDGSSIYAGGDGWVHQANLLGKLLDIDRYACDKPQCDRQLTGRLGRTAMAVWRRGSPAGTRPSTNRWCGSAYAARPCHRSMAAGLRDADGIASHRAVPVLSGRECARSYCATDAECDWFAARSYLSEWL